MKKTTRTNGAHRTVRSRIGSLVAAGAASALLLGGIALINAAPAGAAAPTQLVFSAVPTTATAGGTELYNITVTLLDASNNTPTSNLTDVITIDTTTGAPALSGNSVNAVGGIATFPGIKIDTAGPFTLRATDATLSLTVNASNQTVVSPGAAAGLAFSTQPTSPVTAGATLASFAVSTTDAYGNYVTSGTGTTDAILLTSACVLGGTKTVTESAGVATFNAVSITSGTSPCTLVASDTTGGNTGFTNATSNSITLNAGLPAKLVFTTAPPTGAIIGQSLATFRVSVEDSSGNVETTGSGHNDTISITTTSSGCVITGSPVTAVANLGVATFTTVSFSQGSSCTLTASDVAQSLTVVSQSISVATNVASKLGFSTQPASTVTAGAILPSFAVSIEVSNGQAFGSGSDSIVLTSTCKLVGTTSVAASSGVATFTAVSIQTSGTCTLLATDATHTLATATSSSIVVSASAPTHLAFTTAPPTTSSSTTAALATFRVSVEDVYGNVVTTGTGSTDVVAVTSPCTLTGTTTASSVAGVATFSAVTISTGGVCVLTATDTSRTVTTATATVTVGLPQPALTVTSTKGSVGTPLKLTTSGGAGAGAVTYTVVNGTATCTLSGSSLKANKVGTCLVTATKAASGTYGAVSSVATTVSFGPAGPKATRVVGTIRSGRTSTVTVLGSGFVGRPKVISNVAGFSARVTRDTGKTLTIVVTVRRVQKAGTRVLTIILGNGKRTSVRYTLR